MLQKSSTNGNPDHTSKLRKISDHHMDTSRTKLSSGSPASFESLKASRKDDGSSVRVKLGNYSVDQRKFMQRYVTKLEKGVIVYLNQTASWASTLLLIINHESARFRFTVYFRPVNRFTAVNQYSMPNLELERPKSSQSPFLTMFDLPHGYWQFPLHPNPQECHSFVTPEFIYTPKCFFTARLRLCSGE